MKHKLLGTLAGTAIVVAAAVIPLPARAQGKPATAAKYSPPRTKDGHPDLQGTWARVGVAIAEANGPASPLNDFNATGQPYPTIFSTQVDTGQNRSIVSNRPAGVVDPENRVLPWRPEADAARREFISHMIPPAGLKYLEAYARCVLPGPLEADNRGPYQIIQRPDSFVLLYEYNHVTRVIYTDGRPHLGSNIRLFMGDSLGHWEGDTLVVDTTNYNDKTSLGRTVPYHSEALHTTERFTRVDPNLIDYQITIEEPALFTKPIRIAGAFVAAVPGTELMEFACAEGSQTLPNVFGFEFAPKR
jgi:hypothetical protein